MNKTWILVVVGLALYAGAFFLTGVKEANRSGAAQPGWFCAFVTLLAPWGHDALNSIREGPVDYFSILFSGWINPLFLITLLTQLVWPKGRPALVLRLILLLMFPACWIVFYKMSLYPREGYFTWIAGMLLVMFSVPRARAARPAAKIVSAVDNRVSIS